MKKIIVTILISAVVLTVSGVVSATMLIPAADQAKERAKAPENSPVINEGWGLDRIDFIHYAKSASQARSPKTETCYKLMGVKWNALPVNYIINPTNQQGLDESFITSGVSVSAEIWDSATSKELFSDNYSVDRGVQYGIQDYKNAIDFADYPDANVIAVTSVWYTRVGKKIVEFDIRFNTDFIWGDALSSSTPTAMDLRNIATHELGHAVGLSDIYSASCSSVTMYGYSGEGDIEKRTLEQPDITGLQKMYGI